MPLRRMASVQQRASSRPCVLTLPHLPRIPPCCCCRRATLYVPWKCEHERHSYEKCQYKDYKRRVQQAADQQQGA